MKIIYFTPTDRWEATVSSLRSLLMYFHPGIVVTHASKQQTVGTGTDDDQCINLFDQQPLTVTFGNF